MDEIYTRVWMRSIAELGMRSSQVWMISIAELGMRSSQVHVDEI